MSQPIALAVSAAGLLLAGWLDGQDARMAERYSVSMAGQQLACIGCAGGVK
jgi:sugar/nucleoside kinase (ribokinase family)